MTANADRQAIILIGHGGVPAGFPRHKVRRMMELERQRQADGAPMSEEEARLDHEIRHVPRTPDNDPYYFGIQKLAHALQDALPRQPLYLAFNEFCAPSVPDAVAHAVTEGASDVVLVTTMMTPGGSHAEQEIPELVRELTPQHPDVRIRYAWPFDMAGLAAFMATHLSPYLQRAEAAE